MLFTVVAPSPVPQWLLTSAGEPEACLAVANLSLVPRFSINVVGGGGGGEGKKEPVIKRSHMHQILHTFRVNHYLQFTCLCPSLVKQSHNITPRRMKLYTNF